MSPRTALRIITLALAGISVTAAATHEPADASVSSWTREVASVPDKAAQQWPEPLTHAR